jgi:hypothetical protein
MTKDEVWALLANLRVGTVVAWILVIAAIVVAVAFGIRKLFKLFRDYSAYTEKKEETENRLKAHDETLTKIVQSNEIQTKLLIQVVRSNIIVICQNAITAGYITDVQLREVTELYELYENSGGNSYASMLMAKVKTLPIKHVLGDG